MPGHFTKTNSDKYIKKDKPISQILKLSDKSPPPNPPHPKQKKFHNEMTRDSDSSKKKAEW